MRCDRCRAVISSAEAKSIIRHGVPCGVCGGTLSLCGSHRDAADGRTGGDPNGAPRAAPPSAERRLLGVLRDADGQPVAKQELAAAGIEDPAGTIFELEQAGHCIERAYADASNGRRRFLGYRLRRAAGRQAGGSSMPSSSR
ncbi:MAG: hypothetical protein Q8K79_17540 [Solirubrobacteraceae bacterium]|nr:hypothetical protein [Solirubrobacteraceae bacterium]